MPKYTNPADFLIKLATDPSLISAQLTHQQLVEACSKSYDNGPGMAEGFDSHFIAYWEQNSKRSGKWFIQLYEIFYRLVVTALRSPFVLAPVYIACFCSFIIITLYSNLGQEDIDFLNLTVALRQSYRLMGFCAFLTVDMFANPFFGNVITWPVCRQVYKREVLSGLYSIHIYYFGYFLFKALFLQLYPIILVSIIFPHLRLTDPSLNNYLKFLRYSIVINLNAASLGHAWGVVFDSDFSTVISAHSIIAMATGSFKVQSKRGHNYFVKILKIVSPMTYNIELLFNRIMSENDAKNLLGVFLSYNKGDEYCEKFLLWQSVVFLVFGWLLLLYKT